MTAETDLLPLPPPPCRGKGWEPQYREADMRDYARANVTAALASAQAREEELRKLLGFADEAVRNLQAFVKVEEARTAPAEARAERLEEALRGGMSELEELAREFDSEDNITHDLWAIRNRMQAALSTNAATQTGETNEAAE